MSDTHSLFSGWNETDEGSPVPVHGGGNGASAAGVSVDGISGDMRSVREPSSLRIGSERRMLPAMMRLSAITGMSAAAVLVLGYFGIVSFRGDVSEPPAADTTITITAQGTFDPDSITVEAGQTVAFRNLIKDPQVLKPKSGERELFPVQVLFEEPALVTVPTDAFGTYFYFSETLSDDRILTINVRNRQGEQPSASRGTEQSQDLGIPLPFGNDASTNVTAVSATSSSSSDFAKATRPNDSAGQASDTSSASNTNVHAAAETRVNAVSVEHSGQTVTISLGTKTSPETSEPASPSKSEVPTNPYTVSLIERQQYIARKTGAEKEPLHAGAPLQDLRIARPREVTETGPAGIVLLVVPAIALLTLGSRKRLRQ